MANFAVGQAVEVDFNPPRPDLRVPNQANGVAPGRGDYQTRPDRGVVLEARETPNGLHYLVEVELSVESGIDHLSGRPRVVTSRRKRVIHESKLKAV